MTTSHPIINKPEHLILEPHYVTFHSNDRDKSKPISKWDIQLPQPMHQVYSMQLIDAYIPTNNLFILKNDYQNLAFMIHINNDPPPDDVIVQTEYCKSPYNQNSKSEKTTTINACYNFDGPNAYVDTYTTKMIRIPEGTYTNHSDLANVIQNQLSLKTNHLSIVWTVLYSEINQKFYIYYSGSILNIILDFKSQIIYSECNFDNKQQPTVYHNETHWGLGYNLGFNKDLYNASSKFNFDELNQCDVNDELYVYRHPLLSQSNNYGLITNNLNKAFVSQNDAQLISSQNIYMLVDNYNNIDAISPNNQYVNSTYNNTYNGIVKYAFAKINVEKSKTCISLPNYITHMKNSFESRIHKLSFSFRFHDGRYVYFGKNNDLTFSIVFNCASANPMKEIPVLPPTW